MYKVLEGDRQIMCKIKERRWSSKLKSPREKEKEE